MLLAPLAVAAARRRWSLPWSGSAGWCRCRHLAVAVVAVGLLAAGQPGPALGRALRRRRRAHRVVRPRALAGVMKSGTSGPAGTVALVVVLLRPGRGAGGVRRHLAGRRAGRARWSACRGAPSGSCAAPRVPPARPDGLGHVFTRHRPGAGRRCSAGCCCPVVGGLVVAASWSGARTARGSAASPATSWAPRSSWRWPRLCWAWSWVGLRASAPARRRPGAPRRTPRRTAG